MRKYIHRNVLLGFAITFMLFVRMVVGSEMTSCGTNKEEEIWEEMGKAYLRYFGEGATLEQAIEYMKYHQGPWPSDVRFVLETLSDAYPMDKPIIIRERFEVHSKEGRPSGYAINVSGGWCNYLKIYLFDENGISLPKTEYMLGIDTIGDPNWAPVGGGRGSGISTRQVHKYERVLNEQVVIHRPGEYRMIGMRKWTWWEHDVSVSDIVPIRVVSTNEPGEMRYVVSDSRTFTVLVVTNDIAKGSGALKGEIKPEDVWGNAYRGVELAVRAVRTPYVLGQEIMLDVLARNVGTNTMELKEEGTVFHDFRAMLFTAEGKYLFPKKWQWRFFPVAHDLGTPWPFLFKLKPGRVLKPGEETRYSVNLGEWYDVTEAGAYYLLMMRRVTTWDDGFPVSNLAKLEVTAQVNSAGAE